MSLGFVVVERKCPFCARIILATARYNSNTEPSKWMDIIYKEEGDPRHEGMARMLEEKVGMVRARKKYPTGMALNRSVIFNSCMGLRHFYEFIKNMG